MGGGSAGPPMWSRIRCTGSRSVTGDLALPAISTLLQFAYQTSAPTPSSQPLVFPRNRCLDSQGIDREQREKVPRKWVKMAEVTE